MQSRTSIAGAGPQWAPDDPALDALQGALGVLGAKWSIAVLARLCGGTHRFNGSEVTAIQWSQVVGENFRYELVDIQMRIIDGQNRHGRATGSAQLELTLVRIDPVTSQSVAILTGEGHIHFSADLETDRVVRVENVHWTVAPLP